MAALPEELYLCIDGGGTSLDLRIFDVSSQRSWTAVGPCCNVQTIGTRRAMSLIAETVTRAVQRDTLPSFRKVWLALAGVQGDREIEDLRPFAREMFGDCDVRISNDGHLLASSLLDTDYPYSKMITVVAGTGTVLSSFELSGETDLRCTGMRGGWGYLLGDEGSAYAIGKSALRSVLSSADRNEPFLELHKRILAQWGHTPSALIQKMYDIEISEGERKTAVASLTTLVNSYAYDETKDARSVLLAKELVTSASADLQDAVLDLLRSNGWQASEVAISLGGGVWTQRQYRDLLIAGLKAKGEAFAQVVVVDKPVEAGLKALLRSS